MEWHVTDATRLDILLEIAGHRLTSKDRDLETMESFVRYATSLDTQQEFAE